MVTITKAEYEKLRFKANAEAYRQKWNSLQDEIDAYLAERSGDTKKIKFQEIAEIVLRAFGYLPPVPKKEPQEEW